MSHPSGHPHEPDHPESDQPTEAIDKAPEPEFESAEPTEVMLGSMPEADEPPERRYSAPSGFDVRSTEIIKSPMDPATEVIGTPPPRETAGSRVATPQAIPPNPGRHRSWGMVLGLVLLMIVVLGVLAAAAIFGTIWLTKKNSSSSSPEDQVRQAIQDFDTAIQKGDLAQLRGITCGNTRTKYVSYSDDAWSTAYPRISAAKQYPVVASIDQVIVNDQHAEANVTTFMAYQPQVRSTRSFDLQFLDGRWKICEGPVA
jgi:flagellar basal body-associated protein FliL